MTNFFLSPNNAIIVCWDNNAFIFILYVNICHHRSGLSYRYAHLNSRHLLEVDLVVDLVTNCMVFLLFGPRFTIVVLGVILGSLAEMIVCVVSPWLAWVSCIFTLSFQCVYFVFVNTFFMVTRLDCGTALDALTHCISIVRWAVLPGWYVLIKPWTSTSIVRTVCPVMTFLSTFITITVC